LSKDNEMSLLDDERGVSFSSPFDKGGSKGDFG